MRVSDSQRYANLISQIANQNAALVKASDQVSSGRRWSTLSEDPIAGRQVLQIDSTSRALTQYGRAIGRAQERAASEESTLGQVTDILTRIKQLATSQGSAGASAATRAATAAEVDQLRSQVISLGNTQVAGEFLFGGLEVRIAPFQPDGTYVGTATSRQTAIAPGQMQVTAHSGQEVFVDSGVLDAITALRDALTANDTPAIQQSISSIDGAFDQVQSLLADVGARTTALDQATTMIQARQDALTNHRSELADIPIEEATLNLASIQTALQAAYLATARIQSLSLAEYLR